METKNEIERLMMKIEEPFYNNLKVENLTTHGATTTYHVCDPNIVKTKGNPGKFGTQIQKGRKCSQCKKSRSHDSKVSTSYNPSY